MLALHCIVGRVPGATGRRPARRQTTPLASALAPVALLTALALGAPPNAAAQPPVEPMRLAPAGSGPVDFRYDAPWAGTGSREADAADRRDAAARQAFPSDAPCRWLPARRSGAGPTAAQARGASAADAQALRENMARIETFFSADPRFAAPLGVCMQFDNAGWRGGIEGGHALRGGFLIGAWPGEWLVRRNGRLVYDGETRHIVGDINTMPTDPNNSIDDAQGAMMRADSRVLRPVGTHQGFAVHDGGLLVIARADRPLFRPAAFERLARWVLAELDHRQFEARTGASARARADKAATLRRELNASLAGMSAAERAAPGCFAADEVEFGSRISLVVPAGDARCATRMVEPNPDYFDRSLPPSAIQLVTLRSLPPEPPRGGLVGVRRGQQKVAWMNQAIFWGADWTAFRASVLGVR